MSARVEAGNKKVSLPVDVTELVLSETSLQADSDIERPAGRHSTSDTRHRDDGDILHLDIGGGFWHKHEALVQEVKQSFIGLDGALNTVVTMMAGKVL